MAWQMREGTFATATGAGVPGGKKDYSDYPIPAADAATGFIYPIAEYDHSDDARDGGTVASGIGSGFVYQGSLAPQYRGIYVFTEFVEGKLFAINANAPLSTAMEVFSVPMQYHGITYTSLNRSPIGEGSRSDFRMGEDRKRRALRPSQGTGRDLPAGPPALGGPVPTPGIRASDKIGPPDQWRVEKIRRFFPSDLLH